MTTQKIYCMPTNAATASATDQRGTSFISSVKVIDVSEVRNPFVSGIDVTFPQSRGLLALDSTLLLPVALGCAQHHADAQNHQKDSYHNPEFEAKNGRTHIPHHCGRRPQRRRDSFSRNHLVDDDEQRRS